MKREIPQNWHLQLPMAISREVWAIDKPFTFDDKTVTEIIQQAASSSIDEMLSVSFSGNDKQNQVAVIPMRGTLLKYGTPCSYGADEYAEYLNACAEISQISAVVIAGDSGGGQTSAIPLIANAIKNIQKKGKIVIASVDFCASAMYYIASYCDHVFSDNQGSYVGSIGCMATLRTPTEEPAYINVYAPQSSEKNKAFEEADKGEYNLIREEILKPWAEFFINDVKANRGDKIRLDTPGLFNGKMFYAEDALACGLIDGIKTLDEVIQFAQSITKK